MKLTLRSPLRKSVLSPFIASMYGGSTAPSFTVLFEPLTNATGTVTTLAYINAATGSGDITPLIAESRLTGAAPLYVHFDASGTTATSLTSEPFHELEYTWNFGDTGAGSWSNGARAEFSLSSSKDADIGPIAAHVFETPGTYTVTLNVRYDGTSATPITKTITVTDPDTVFSGANTVCIANGTLPVAGVNGVPTGATCINTSDADAEITTQLAAGRKRILFKRGDSFNVSTSILIRVAGPGHIGAYGTGADPIFTNTAELTTFSISHSSTPGLSDWRITDIDIDCGSYANGNGYNVAGEMDDLLFHKLGVTNAKYGFLSSGSNLSTSAAFWDKHCFSECTVTNSIGAADSGANCMYIAAERLAVLGCALNPNNSGEHGLRSSFSNIAVYAHNTVEMVRDGKAYMSIRVPFLNTDNPATSNLAHLVDVNGDVWSEKICVHDNFTDPSGVAGTMSSIGAGPVNQDFGIGRVRDVIFERNYLINGQILPQNQTTVRNNLLTSTTVGNQFAWVHMAYQDDVQDVWVYNNTTYSTGTYDIQYINAIGGTYTGATATFRNNLVYAPNGTKPSYSTMFYNPGLVTVTESNNTAWANYTSVTPNFTATPPVAPANWKPTTGYAVGGGTTVPVWTDFFGTTVTGATREIGAVKA